MKNFTKLFSLMFAVVLGLGAMSCSDDDNDLISPDKLPEQAKTFISTYFPSATILNTVKDKDEYDVTLTDGTTIDFDKAGNWKDVDATPGKTVPSGFYPSSIDSYIAENYPGQGVNEISRDKRGYEVELTSTIDLHFDTEGVFVRVDRD